MIYSETIIIAIFYILDIVVLIIEIVSTIDVILIIEFVSTIVVLAAEIVSAEDTLIIFKDIIIVFTVRFVFAEVLFVSILFVNIKTN